MSPTLTAPRWRIDGNVTDDGNDTAFMAAWPRRIHQDFSDDLSAPSALPPPSRRMMPEVPDDPEKPAPAEGRVKDKKKPEHPSSSNPQGAPKNKPVPKPPLPPTPIPKSKPPAAPPVKKNKPIPEPVDSSPGNPYVPTPPKVKDIEPEPEPEPSGIDDPPPLPPVIDTGSIPPESDGEGEPDSPIEAASPKPAENEVKDSPIADIGDDNSDPLTGEAANDVIGEHPHTNAIQNLFSKAGDYFKDLIGGIFPKKTEVPSSDSFSHSYVPVALPPPRNPAVELDPVGSFRAGYISQRDLETSIGRDEWTMCCAATFVYAVQSKYPGLGRDEIIEAAGRAANTPLADGSGSCVSDSGYISSIYQYSQALSENLGLDEYIDTPGKYPSLEAARDAGVEMMKVELRGRINGRLQEHHVLQLHNAEIDPVAGRGINDHWDENSRKVESVMALNWFSLP